MSLRFCHTPKRKIAIAHTHVSVNFLSAFVNSIYPEQIITRNVSFQA